MLPLLPQSSSSNATASRQVSFSLNEQDSFSRAPTNGERSDRQTSASMSSAASHQGGSSLKRTSTVEIGCATSFDQDEIDQEADFGMEEDHDYSKVD